MDSVKRDHVNWVDSCIKHVSVRQLNQILIGASHEPLIKCIRPDDYQMMLDITMTERQH